MKWIVYGTHLINLDSVIEFIISGDTVTAQIPSGTDPLTYPTDEWAQYAYQAIMAITGLPQDGSYVISDYFPKFAIGKCNPSSAAPTDVVTVTGVGFDVGDTVWLSSPFLSVSATTTYVDSEELTFVVPANPFGFTATVDVFVIKTDGKTKCRLVGGLTWST